MTTIVINPKGTARYNEFSRVEEYAFCIRWPGKTVNKSGSDMLTKIATTHRKKVCDGVDSLGPDSKGLQVRTTRALEHPIFLKKSDFSITSIGDAIAKNDRSI